MKIKELDIITKILLILLITSIFYLAIFSLLKPFFITKPSSIPGVFGEIINDILDFSASDSLTINLVSLIFSLIIAVISSYNLFKPEQKAESEKENEIKIIRKALSDDEKAVLDEIKKAKEITQDSLRFRLNWSKAKISTILTNLDRLGIIQRERIGKTYKVYLQK
jgi:uncharacterized membrane protein